MDNFLVPKSSEKVLKKIICESCDYYTSRKSQYERHLLTSKHIKNNLDKNKDNQNSSEKYICKCGKIYKYLSGLSKHKKNCKQNCIIVDKSSDFEELFEDIDNNYETEDEDKNAEKILIYQLVKQNMELVTQNQEFKQMMLEQNKQTSELQKQMLEIAKDTKTMTINNTTNNNKFNMNIFLNEKCKDALNIMDFVTSLPLNLEDLEETGKQGYVKGLSRILVNGLKGIDISKRPIHCSDLKRETFYIKDNNVWEKEDAEKKRIKNAIKYISLKNAKQITQWTKENEGYRDSHNKKSDVYLKLVYEANGGDDDELNKIIKNISANVTIDKNDSG
jgi:hypothetical protein